MTYIGVDGCPDGWIAVEYCESRYEGVERFDDIEELWDRYNEAESILVDVPIGLWEERGDPRPCDDTARDKLSPKRHNSVFPVPVRTAVYQDSYEDAKERQEKLTDRSLGTQSWAIADKIEELDELLLDSHPGAVGTIREAHPEICFWALNGGGAMEYSKTGQPAAAFWERVNVLEGIDEGVIQDIRDAGSKLDCAASNDDLLDAFALAVTASQLTGALETLHGSRPADDGGGPEDLPMEMVYAKVSKS